MAVAPANGSDDEAEALPRVRLLAPGLADQIAAGEVVERPASVVRELVDNALDAGARRIEVEVRRGGADGLVVVDDGHGVHPEDLELSVTRHATSKVRRAADLVDVATLGFRGEALASIAAVARVRIRSRRRGVQLGHALDVGPTRPPRLEPVGMPVGTRVEVDELFATIPARRKFLRGEATELGHVTEAVLRAALVHPGTSFVVRTPGRTLLELPACEEDVRIGQVLARRGRGVLEHHGGVHEGTRVDAWILRGDGVARAGQGVFVIVRQRVVRERHLARILAESAAVGLAAGQHPIACLRVEPGPGAVDVNVHPQKAEIRFADAQRIYASVRAVLEPRLVPPAPSATRDEPRSGAREALGNAVARWAAQAEPPPAPRSPAGEGSYRLRTHARAGDYRGHREQLRIEAGRLADARRADLAEPGSAAGTADFAASATAPSDAAGGEPAYLTCLPGPVGIFRVGDGLLAVDLRALRAHLLHRRLQGDLGSGTASAQALLHPAVVPLSSADVACVERGAQELARLGVLIEPFGRDAALVRAVPATLRGCIDEPDAADLVARVLPWLRMRDQVGRGDDLEEAAAAIARTGGADPAPRLARRWLAELVERGEPLERVPGVRRWTASELAGTNEDDDGR